MAFRRGIKRSAFLLGLGAVLSAAFVAAGMFRPELLTDTAVIYEAVCRQLLLKTTVGRQALVSSVWWPPLAFLARLPAAALTGSQTYPVASLILSAVFGAADLFLLARMLRDAPLGAGRCVIAGALAAHPEFIRASCSGGTGTMALFLALLAAHGLMQWADARRLRYLVYFGAGGALLTLMGLDLILWTGLGVLLLGLDVARAGFSRARREAVMILGVLPAFYAAALWVLMNWLIMGDPVYFLRSLWMAGERLPGGNPLAPFGSADWIAAAVCALLAAVSLRRGHRSGAALALLGLGLPVLALGLAGADRLWGRDPLLPCLFPFGALALAHPAWDSGRFRNASRAARCFIPAALAAAAWITGPPSSAEGARGRGPAAAAASDAWVARLERHVKKQSPFVKVFACGYDSFALLGPRPPETFRHSLDFDFNLEFNKEARDYRGHALYVLVHRPEGRSAMDSIHWKYGGMFFYGVRSTLYDGDWDGWRLFEIIQAPRVLPEVGIAGGAEGSREP